MNEDSVCRGSWHLGSACGQCRRCREFVKGLMAKKGVMLGALRRARRDLIAEYNNRIYEVNFRYIDEAIEAAEKS